ncbi:MAG: hypothetical protein ACTTKP_05690 [Catonella sp.]|uniref:hypothetical protein n=1 Tax=Catonella sp. TaxID=2382125 RepID=UPI003FA0BD28
MEFLVAEEGIPQSIGCEGAVVAYYGSEIEFHYETVPPHGDEIFTAKLPLLDIKLPFNIHTGKYASLEHWYNNISVKEKEVELKNDYDEKSMVLIDVNGLKWV